MAIQESQNQIYKTMSADLIVADIVLPEECIIIYDVVFRLVNEPIEPGVHVVQEVLRIAEGILPERRYLAFAGKKH